MKKFFAVFAIFMYVITTGTSEGVQENRGDASVAPPYTIVAVGDLYFGGGLGTKILNEGVTYPFRNVKHILTQADVTIGNLESPLSLSGSKYVKDKQFYLRADPRTVGALLDGGIDMVSLANNHIMDYGPVALEETRKVLAAKGIAFSGAGSNLSEARKAAIVERNGRKVALLSAARVYPVEFYAKSNKPGMVWADPPLLAADIKKAREAGAEIVVVAFHWSGEMYNYPKPYQEELAHAVIKAGADIIVGHHPHVLQGIEIYNGKVIAYSLGNFAFGSLSKKVKDSAIFQFEWEDGRVKRVRIYPVNVANYEVNFQTRLRTGEDAQRVIGDLRTFSAKYKTEIRMEGDVGIIEVDG